MREEVIFCDRVISNGTSSSASLASSIASSLSLRNSYVTRQLTRVSILTRLPVRISICLAASCASFSEQRRTSLACYCAFAVNIHADLSLDLYYYRIRLSLLLLFLILFYMSSRASQFVMFQAATQIGDGTISRSNFKLTFYI